MRRVVVTMVAAVAWWLASCREIPAPEEGVFSISPLILPSPGLVVGDTMRDSLGFAAPLSVIAYDREGNPVSGVTATFIVRDTGSHIEGQYLIGDHTITTVVLGAVAGLQTDTVHVPVTLPPQQLIAADSVRHTLTPEIVDTVATSQDLRVRVVNSPGPTPIGIRGIVVRYHVARAPVPISDNAGPTVIFIPGSQTEARDTTDGTGLAGRAARFRFLAIPPTATDSAVINATASYRGQTLGTVQFTVVFTKQ
jgi:hypothetical protein